MVRRHTIQNHSQASVTMCKFNHRLFGLFVAALGVLINSVAAKTALDSILKHGGGDENQGFDVYFDQRQKGNDNFRLNLDGFFFSIPVSAVLGSEGSAADIAALLETAIAPNRADQDLITVDDSGRKGGSLQPHIHPVPVLPSKHDQQKSQQQQIIDAELSNLKKAQSISDELKFSKGSRARAPVLRLIDILRQGAGRTQHF